MNIGKVAKITNISAKTIRYYDEIGLVTPAAHSAAGYRDYDDSDIHMLQFVNRARSLNFSIKDCRELLSLYNDKNRASGDVKMIAKTHMDEINRKITELKDMHQTLKTLMDKCQGNDRPECPILHGLAGLTAAS